MLKPLGVGALMAALMIWMLHEPIMAGSVDLTFGALAFVMAHVAMIAGFLLLYLCVPRVRAAVKRHRPSLPHVAGMAGGMALSAIAIHLVLHGGMA